MLRFLLWITLLICEAAAIKKLRCKSECHERRSTIILDDKRRLSCTITGVDKPPTASPTIGIAPAPNLIEGQMWHIYHNRKIALNITWMQKESDLSNRQVKGYYITVEDLDFTGTWRYHVAIKITGKTRTQTRPTEYISFQFLCHGRSYSDTLLPTSTRRISVESLPLADYKHEDGQIVRVVTIPECTDESGKSLSFIKDKYIVGEHCEEFWSRAADEVTTPIIPHPTTKRNAQNSKNVATFIWIPFLSIALLISVMAVIFIWKKRKIQVKQDDILVIADTDNDTEVQTHHQTMEKLSQQLGFKVQSNWSSRNIISKESAAIWFKERIKNTKIIIFIEPPVSSETNENTEYQQFWHLFLNSRIQHKQSIFLQRSGQEHRYSPKEFKNLKVFPLKHEYTKQDAFYKYMKKWSMVSTKKRDRDRMHQSVDYAKTGARPKCSQST